MENEKPPINISKASAIVDGDVVLFSELLDIFFEGYPNQADEIGRAIENNDPVTLRYFAHQLKGGLRNFAAERACEAAYELEKAGENGKAAGSEEKFVALRHEIEKIEEYYKSGVWKKEFEGTME